MLQQNWTWIFATSRRAWCAAARWSSNWWNAARSGFDRHRLDLGEQRLSFTQAQFTNRTPRDSGDDAIVTNAQPHEHRSAFAGLNRFNPAGLLFGHVKSDRQDAGGLSDNRVTALASDIDGRLWIGTYDGVVHRLDAKSGAIDRHVLEMPDLQTNGESVAVNALHVDGEGEGVARIGEGDHERVAFCLDFVAGVPIDLRANDRVVVREGACELLGQALPELGGALHIGEDERDGSCRVRHRLWSPGRVRD